MKEITLEAEQVKVAAISDLRNAARQEGVFWLAMEEISSLNSTSSEELPVTSHQWPEGNTKYQIPNTKWDDKNLEFGIRNLASDWDTSIEKAANLKEYTIPIPPDADKSYLLKLKEFLQKQESGDIRVYIDLHGQKVDTKIQVSSVSGLKNMKINL